MRLIAFLGLFLLIGGCAQMTNPFQPGQNGGPLSREAGAGLPEVSVGEPDRLAIPHVPERVKRGSAYGTLVTDVANEEAYRYRGFWAALLPKLELKPVDHHQVHAFIRYYRRHPEYLKRVFKRGKPFLPYILRRLEERDMPADLALLPVVESAFRPFAYSSGRAAGIWQFTPGTGRHFGLKQTWWYDGRRDILAATDAALKYLDRLHGKFDDWLLALAAYNSGPGNVSWAMRYNRRRGRATDFWNLPLPRETQGYAPKLLALSHVVRNAERYGIELPAIPNRKGFEVVELEAPLDLARAAKLGSLDIETLYRMNPGLNQWCTPPNGPDRLLVPAGNADRVRSRLAKLDPSERVRWVRHRIASGETLSEIAAEYRTTVPVLRRVNNLRNNIITAGDHLVVPTASSRNKTYALSRSQRLAAIRRDGPSGRTRVVHRVRKGESLWEISRRFGVDMGRLAEWNGMAPGDTLQAGEHLTVWVRKSGGSGQGRTARVRYRVRRGDSLWSISREFNVPLSRLRRWNGLSAGQLIHPGDRLTIYVDPTHLAEHRG